MVISATPSKFVLYQFNSEVIQVQGLQDFLTGNYMNTATVTATLVDRNGISVPECVNVPFTYVPLSNGNYNGVFGDNNFSPEPGTGYTLVVDAVQAPGYGHWEFLVEVKVRQS